jgi:hypothetical protein
MANNKTDLAILSLVSVSASSDAYCLGFVNGKRAALLVIHHQAASDFDQKEQIFHLRAVIVGQFSGVP